MSPSVSISIAASSVSRRLFVLNLILKAPGALPQVKLHSVLPQFIKVRLAETMMLTHHPMMLVHLRLCGAQLDSVLVREMV